MKYYETHYEEYIQSVKNDNIHPELDELFRGFPATIPELGNLIIYGSCGSGKYSQMLYLLERYSPSHLKYDKKLQIQTDKQSYIYRISDIHYEIDMALLGCHSKTLWHEAFFQIVDILLVKPDKTGVIVCKNFHAIHSELLEVFYSYIQHSNTLSPNVNIRFILLSEHISFIPNNILNCCAKIGVSKPSVESFAKILRSNSALTPEKPSNTGNIMNLLEPNGIYRTLSRSEKETEKIVVDTSANSQSAIFLQKIGSVKRKLSKSQIQNAHRILKTTDNTSVLNLKEIQSFATVENESELPKDIFNIICDNIIQTMINASTLEFTEFRENLYDILIYNLDITECLWYIFGHLIKSGYIGGVNRTPTASRPALFEKPTTNQSSDILSHIYVFLKYYNNNYRPIYHLESIFFYLLLQIQTPK